MFNWIKKEKKPIPASRRAQTRWQKERRFQRMVFFGGIFVVAAALLTVVSGWFFTQYYPGQKLAITVNGTSVDMNYYADVLAYQGWGTAQSQLEQLMEQNELVRQAALEMGTTVTEEEIVAELEEREIDVSESYKKGIESEVLSLKLIDTTFEQQVPVSATQRELQAMFLETKEQALEIRDRLIAGENFGELATELSLDGTTQESAGYLDWHPEEVMISVIGSTVFVDNSFKLEAGELSQPIYDADKEKSVGYWLIEVLDQQEDQAHVQAMLIGDATEAQEIHTRLEAGEDFGELAVEFSNMPNAAIDKGNLGYMVEGDRGDLFDSFVFNGETEPRLSDPIFDDSTSTKGGYWLIEVLNEETRLISNEDREIMKIRAYYEWVASLWDNPDNVIESVITPEMHEWAVEQAKKRSD